MRMTARLVIVVSVASVLLHAALLSFWGRPQSPETPSSPLAPPKNATTTLAGRKKSDKRRPGPKKKRLTKQELQRLRGGQRAHLRAGRPKRPRAATPPITDLAAASRWAPRRLAWSRGPPSPNATEWLPQFGGRCEAASGLPPLPNLEDDAEGGGEAIKALADVGFALPRGCVALKKKSGGGGFDDDDEEPSSCDFGACAPNLFLIGASKSGTTTLFEALAAHPRIFEMFAEEHTDGETHTFTHAKTDREYVLRLARASPPLPRSTLLKLLPDDEVDVVEDFDDERRDGWLLDDARGGPAYVLEYTPHYLVLPEARERLCDTLRWTGAPSCRRAKYVVVLRDPAKRAFSQYVMKTHMRVTKYNDPRSFEDAANVGRQRTKSFADCWDHALLRGGDGPPSEGSLTLRDFDEDNKKDGTVRRSSSSLLKAKIHRLALGTCNVKRFEPNAFQAYVLKSAYFYQLLPWLAGVDDPRASFLVLTLETFGRDELTRLMDFLGLALFVRDDDGDRRDGFRHDAELHALVSARRNVARDGGKARLSLEQRTLLDDFFRPMNSKLDRLVAPLLGRTTTGYPT